MTKLIYLSLVGPALKDYLCISVEATLKFTSEASLSMICYSVNK